MTLTRSSSGRGSLSSSCSMLKGPKFLCATAAVICIADLFPERIFELAVPVFRRIYDHLLVAGQILLEAAALHVLELPHDRTRLRPLAERIEPDLPDNGVEGAVMDVLGKLLVIDAAGRGDGLLQHLHGGVGKRRLVEAERIQ